MPVVLTEYLKTASARSSLSRTACQRALSELNWGTLLRVADVEIVFILPRYHCRLWQKLRFLLSNSANLPRGPLSHFPTESPRLESPRTRIINPYPGSPFNISMRYIHSAILNPNFLSQEEVVTIQLFSDTKRRTDARRSITPILLFDSLAAPPHGFVSSGDSNGANHHRFRRSPKVL
jgi:hypothetical protein